MSESPINFDPTEAEDKAIDLTLIECESPVNSESDFFIKDTGRNPDVNRLVQVAQLGNIHELLLSTFEEIGLVPDIEKINAYVIRYSSLVTKNVLDKIENSEFELLDRRLNAYTRILDLIDVAQNYYNESFFIDQSSQQEDTEKINKLYDDTEAYLGCPLLTVFEKLRGKNEIGRDVMSKQTVNQADRIARILIQNETNG